MAVREPQNDLPAGVSGGADIWDDGAAGALLSADYFEAATSGADVNASLTQTDQADTLAASAELTVSASATLTDQADTLSATAEVPVAGVAVTANITDQADTASSTAQVLVQPALTQKDEADTLAGAAAVAVVAALTTTDAADTLAATAEIVAAGGVLVTADLTDAGDTLEASVTVAQPEAIKPSNAAKFDVPFRRVYVQASLTDDDDTVQALATVQVIEQTAEPIVVRCVAAVVDDADTVGASCVSRWERPRLVRSTPDLIRSKALAAA